MKEQEDFRLMDGQMEEWMDGRVNEGWCNSFYFLISDCEGIKCRLFFSARRCFDLTIRLSNAQS